MNTTKLATEQSSKYNDLEKMTVEELLVNMNNEDKLVPSALEKAIPMLKAFILAAEKQMQKGGRLFYIGAGTSGRLGVLDASECPPTFGVTDNVIIGLIAGQDIALRKAVENAEDDVHQAWIDLQKYYINENDVVLGIAASGTTPYVIGGIKAANKKRILTGCITCNSQSPLAKVATHPIELVVGPEFVTGSTRMKAGTAQKLALNMISTSLMIRMGRIKGNRMVDMKLSNIKLTKRGIKMLVDELKISKELANELLKQHGSVRGVMDVYKP